MHALPPNAPENLYEAFDYIGSVRQPTVDDFRLMILLEAAGKDMYDALAESAPDPETRQLLIESGRDEYLHAERMAEVVTLLTGEPIAAPSRAENPYLAGWQKPELSVRLIENLINAEARGEAMYEGWAATCPNPDAARLLRMNGREETSHAERLRLVAERLTRCLRLHE